MAELEGLTRDEKRVAAAVASKLLELADKGVPAPTRVAVHKTQFLGRGTLLGLKIFRVGYILKNEAALLLVTDDVVRYPLPSVEVTPEGTNDFCSGHCAIAFQLPQLQKQSWWSRLRRLLFR